MIPMHRILIVKTVVAAAATLQTVLASRGYDVTIVQSREAALSTIRLRRLDVILVDAIACGPPIEHLIDALQKYRPQARLILIGTTPSTGLIGEALGIASLIEELMRSRIPHPGDCVDHHLKARKLSSADLAKRMGISTEKVDAILEGRGRISSVIAWLLADAFDTSPEYWLHLQAEYSQKLAALKPEHYPRNQK
jgi:antitoxin HigA-1